MEKISIFCQIIGVHRALAKTAKMKNILDVFSALYDPIELIPFELLQASQDSHLEYQQHIILNQSKFFFFRDDPP